MIVALIIMAGVSSYVTILSTQKRNSSLSKHYSIGQNVNINDVSLNVESLRYDIRGSASNQLKSGYQYLITTVVLTNNLASNFEMMPLLYFYIKDGQGNIYNVSVADIYGEQLTGPILPGESVREEIAFEVPINVDKPTLYFQRGTPDHAVVAFDLFK